jgi:hypothetical protein
VDEFPLELDPVDQAERRLDRLVGEDGSEPAPSPVIRREADLEERDAGDVPSVVRGVEDELAHGLARHHVGYSAGPVAGAFPPVAAAR